MINDVIVIPSFQKRIKRKNKSHIRTVYRLIQKLRKMGKDSLKFIDVEDYFVLSEMKVKKPPYRLYVIFDQKNNKYYIVDWEHKNNQQKIIYQLKRKLFIALEFGLEKIFI